MNARERFTIKVRETHEGCWEWMGARNQYGYGRFLHDGEIYAHRWAWRFIAGKTIDDGREIDHLCRNRWCVNPEHLEAVPHRENMRRRSVAQKVCVRGHERTGPGGCKVCNRERLAAWKTANPERWRDIQKRSDAKRRAR